MRFPPPSYREKIWDHCAGFVIVEEAGGKVTDAAGTRLDFSKGRWLDLDRGIVAAPPQVGWCGAHGGWGVGWGGQWGGVSSCALWALQLACLDTPGRAVQVDRAADLRWLRLILWVQVHASVLAAVAKFQAPQ
jgi:hypothetical protein